MNIKISIDSACDLRHDVIEKFNIGVIPLTIVCGDEEFKDGHGFTTLDLFERSEAGLTCTSAAISVGEYIDVFDTYLKEFDTVIHVNLCGDISACHQNALIAAENRPVFVIDSRSLSSGAGMLALAAAELAESGMAAGDIVKTVLGLIDKAETSFVIDTLKYLHRGGRCSGVAALGANILKLKPCIEMENGKMDVGKKYRGSFDTVILQYIRERLAGRTDIDYKRIFMTCTPGISDETLEKVRSEILACGPFEDIQQTDAGCTIANHCGPKTLGVLFFTK